MFERFTERARRVLFFARYEASELGSPSIEPEHLLLGLIREGKGLTTRILAGWHLSLDNIRKEIEGRVDSRDRIPTSVEIPFSPGAKHVLHVAVEEADTLRHTSITRDAFLSLDRNGNWLIDDSSELFGNLTQGASGDKNRGSNGFAALALFDLRVNAGNRDGLNSAEDTIFASLKLWTDGNHDGISQPSELGSLQESGVAAVSLRYAAASHLDESGKMLRFQTVVTMAKDALDYGLPRSGAQWTYSLGGGREMKLELRLLSLLLLCWHLPPVTALAAQSIITVRASPSVETTIAAIEGKLAALVLWRGRPGWTLSSAGLTQDSSMIDSRPGGHRNSGGGSADGTISVAIQRGAISLDLSYRPRDGVVLFRGKKLQAPPGTNVILVDGVDRPEGPASPSFLTIDPGTANIDPRSGSLGPLLGRSPEVVAFLQCDAPLPEPKLPPGSPPSVKEMILKGMKGYCDDIPG